MVSNFDDAASALNSRERTSTSNDSGSDSEYDNPHADAPIVNAIPQSAIAFDKVLEIGIMGGLNDEQNIRVGKGQTNDAVITLKGASVADGTLYKASEGQHGADYKLVNPNEEMIEDLVEKEDGEYVEKGIRQYGERYESEVVEDFEEDVIRLMRGKASGVQMLRQLDVNGDNSAYYDEDGNYSGGLIEYPNGYASEEYNPKEENYERVAAVPQLRDDMEDESGTLFFYFGDDYGQGNRMHKADVFKGDVFDDDGDILTENVLAPQSGERDDDAYYNLEWHEEDDFVDDSNESEGGDDGDDINFSDGIVDSDTSSDESSELVYDDLTDNQQNFIDKCVEEGVSGETTDKFDEVIDGFVEQGMDAISADDATRLITERE